MFALKLAASVIAVEAAAEFGAELLEARVEVRLVAPDRRQGVGVAGLAVRREQGRHFFGGVFVGL